MTEAKKRGLQVPTYSARSKTFQQWLPEISPELTWDWHFQNYIYPRIEETLAMENGRLIIEAPPRHGKSELVTIRLPIYFLEANLRRHVVVGSYSQGLATKFSRSSRRLARQRFALSKERAAATDWETRKGGGLRAVGVGAGITGHGADLIIVDDPVKSREEANSPTHRSKVWDWFNDDLYTRLHPGAPIIVIATRWHYDDLIGRIINSELGSEWQRIQLPAIAEKDDPLGRSVGQALCPERYPLEDLLRIKQQLGPWSFGSLYQQSPTPRDGGVLNPNWLGEVPAPPASMKPLIRYWDKAATLGDGAYSTGVLMGKHGDTYYILDVVRGQWSVYQRNQTILRTARFDDEKYGSRKVVTVVEQEPGSGGKESALRTISQLAGFRVKRDLPKGSKETRVEPFADQAEAGFVRIVRAIWNQVYTEEMGQFPFGQYKDQVDATSGAFKWVSADKESNIY